MSGVGVVEAGETRDEVQLDGSGGAVALLGQDDLRFGAVGVGLLFVAVVIGLAVYVGYYLVVMIFV